MEKGDKAMGLRFIYGTAGTGKSEFCFNEIKNNIKNKEKIYIITPEQFSYSAEKKLLEEINTNASVNAEVISFNRIANRVFTEVGGANEVLISKSSKAMLIYSILEKEKKNLKFLNSSDDNIDIILKEITELKKHNITTLNIEEENKKIPRAGGPIAPASLTIPRGGGKIPLSHKRNPANCRGCIFIHPVKMQSPVPHSLRFADVCVTAIGDAFFGAQLRLRTFLLLEEGMSDDAESGLRRCGAAFAPCGFGLRRRGRAGCSACIRTSGRRCVCAGRDGRAAAL